jgi:hypothetical protein
MAAFDRHVSGPDDEKFLRRLGDVIELDRDDCALTAKAHGEPTTPFGPTW